MSAFSQVKVVKPQVAKCVAKLRGLRRQGRDSASGGEGVKWRLRQARNPLGASCHVMSSFSFSFSRHLLLMAFRVDVTGFHFSEDRLVNSVWCFS